MKLLALCAPLMLCSISGLHAADLVSGTWTSGDGTAVRIYVFKASGDRLTGIVCGPCDNPACSGSRTAGFWERSEPLFSFGIVPVVNASTPLLPVTS